MIRVICLWKPFLEIINYGGKSGGKPKGLSILNTETHPNQDEHVLISRQREQIEFCKKFTWSNEGRSFHSHQNEVNHYQLGDTKSIFRFTGPTDPDFEQIQIKIIFSSRFP